MYYLKDDKEVGIMRRGASILSRVHGVLAGYVKPGIRTKKLDDVAEEFILDSGALPSFKGYNGFPASICVSVNDEVVHGIPGDYVLCDGDVVSIDCGVLYSGFHTDSAYTHVVGKVGDDLSGFLKVSKESLYLGIEHAVAGNRVGDVSYAIQSHVESNGYSVVRELVGHGVGRDLHEEPEVPCYGVKGRGIRLKKGMVLAVEVMINLGSEEVTCDLGTSVYRTLDGGYSCHFEHTVALFDSSTEVLTSFSYINSEL
jgi:methionyl aminopeptidase